MSDPAREKITAREVVAIAMGIVWFPLTFFVMIPLGSYFDLEWNFLIVVVFFFGWGILIPRASPEPMSPYMADLNFAFKYGDGREVVSVMKRHNEELTRRRLRESQNVTTFFDPNLHGDG